MRHVNSGACPKCFDIMSKYPGFYAPLGTWFLSFQKDHPEAHISCAGRGRDDQETLYQAHRSKAHYGESAHNWNAALDIWENSGDLSKIYERLWFIDILKPALPSWVEWYGRPGAAFQELPHVQPSNWKRLRDTGLLSLVEPMEEDEIKWP